MDKTVTVGVQTFAVPPATPADAIAVQDYVTAHTPKPLQLLADVRKDPLWEALGEDERRALALEAGRAHLQGETIASEQVQIRLLLRPEHAAFFAWALLRKANPSATLEWFRDHVNDDNAAVLVFDLIEKSGFAELGKRLGRPGG